MLGHVSRPPSWDPPPSSAGRAPTPPPPHLDHFFVFTAAPAPPSLDRPGLAPFEFFFPKELWPVSALTLYFFPG